MSDTINWLHLTDLHLGLDAQGWLWPHIKHEFFADLEKLKEDIGKIDLIFFTGDFTQQGRSEEFNLLNKELGELLNILSKDGVQPKFCVVPGNHDLSRPSPDSPHAKVISRLWQDDSVLRLKFWTESDGEYRKAIESYFSNYTNWINNSSLPIIEMKKGALPGDFSAIFEKGKQRLGIVGLNSTFLQIAPGDFKEKLELHVSQINAVCGGDATRWAKQQTSNVLLTHQPPNWLAPEVLKEFRQLIYPPGRFVTQFCGHQHKPESIEKSEAGESPRRLNLGPSLFGLENWNGLIAEKRIHGYTAGQFIFEQGRGILKTWPRIAISGHGGGIHLAPDHNYRLKNDCYAIPFSINDDENIAANLATNSVTGKTNTIKVHEKNFEVSELKLLDALPDEQTARNKLKTCQHFAYPAWPQHNNIRQDEQTQFELEIRKNRLVWITADWGSGSSEFIASAIERLRIPETTPEIFHIKCDDAETIEAFESLFPQQFGMSLPHFCGYAGPLKSAFLVLEAIHPFLCKNDNLKQLKRIALAILDYSPNLNIIFSSTLAPERNEFIPIELKPLEVPDVRTYVMFHPEASSELQEPEVVERIHELSDGLPMHLDRMIKASNVSSVTSVLNASMKITSEVSETKEGAPKALVYAVSRLADSQDIQTKRSFRLLKVLAILPYGETLDSLKHFLPAETFHHENALQLKEFALIDVIPLQLTFPQIGMMKSNDKSAPKLLKIQRHVKDYIQPLISLNEKKEIIMAGVERYFGSEWRAGKVKLRKQPIEYQEYLHSGVGNEFALINHLVELGKNSGDKLIVKKAAGLGVHYMNRLEVQERYRDVVTVTETFCGLLDSDELPEHWCNLAKSCGDALRMLGKHDEGLIYLKSALEIGGEYLSKDRKGDIYLDIALCYDKNGRKTEAIAAANKVKEFAQRGGSAWLHAESILVRLNYEESEIITRLEQIEKKARKANYKSLADSMLLELASRSRDNKNSIRYLNKVIEAEHTSNDNYNHFRAVVNKATLIHGMENPPLLKAHEIASLAQAYSYFHAQRFGSVFNLCHEALWQIFESDSTPERLLRLFRHSSFIWRIRGDEDREKNFLARLSVKHGNNAVPLNTKAPTMEFGYFFRRMKIILISAIPANVLKQSNAGAKVDNS